MKWIYYFINTQLSTWSKERWVLPRNDNSELVKWRNGDVELTLLNYCTLVVNVYLIWHLILSTNKLKISLCLMHTSIYITPICIHFIIRYATFCHLLPPFSSLRPYVYITVFSDIGLHLMTYQLSSLLH